MGDRRSRERETLSRDKDIERVGRNRGFQVWVWPLAYVLRTRNIDCDREGQAAEGRSLSCALRSVTGSWKRPVKG